MLILIVDTSIHIIERLEEIISETEIITTIHRAVSYEEANNLTKENKHDVLLLDIDLPGNGSLKLLKEVKTNSKETSVIILFTYMDIYMKEQYKSLGVDYFFDKYYDYEQISELLFSISFINEKKI